MGSQGLYLALWIAGGLLWAGPPRELPRFASPVRLGVDELQGRWTHKNGQVYEVREEWFCPVGERAFPEHPSPFDCSTLDDSDGRLTFFVDDQRVPARTYRRWGRDVLVAEWDGLTFSRPVPQR
ncbi:hypothetical protein [Deinococcus budaensis]|uniref:Uncharacterized protein n=1 Tax=Deinococcus budaensis TaxID=1665626 RepID=A0A7W8GD27_9DEIO|nr:hypothetical protein [Deinococcus budaensis]MBB5233263.1 hypothetical protein [Deinococcus budaensis]